jgi:RNA-directed DNA polymerase
MVERWLKRRGYAHFDRPCHPDFAKSYAESSGRVERHSFWPFIKFEKRTPRFTRDPKTGLRKRAPPKCRPILYAAHLDSAIYGRYSSALSAALEAELKSTGVSDCVTAYRRLDGRSNIHFALEAFNEVRRRGECDVVAMDVSDFFGSLAHDQILNSWRVLFRRDRLRGDEWAIYRSMIRYASISRDKLREVLGRDIPRRSLSNERVCTPAEFRDKVRPALELQRASRGIPQGLPISAVTANVYMLDFDRTIHTTLGRRDVWYRRYSDDILLVCPSTEGGDIGREVSQQLSRAGLVPNEEKTEILRFTIRDGEPICEKQFDGSWRPSQLQYLGFSFDGERVNIRPASWARFLKRAMGAVKSGERAARRKRSPKIRRRSIYRRFTALPQGNKSVGAETSRLRNFPRYAIRAANLLGADPIRKAVGKHWVGLNRELIARDPGNKP